VEAVTKVRLVLATAGANAADERVIRGKRNNKTFFVFIIMVLCIGQQQAIYDCHVVYYISGNNTIDEACDE
jgi:hypothetical protein